MYSLIAALCIFLTSVGINATTSLNLGYTLQYTRYHQGSLPEQVGFMTGPAVEACASYCNFTAYLGFKGLWDIEYICSNNGLIVDSKEYQTNFHFGYNWQLADHYSFTPFTGLDFIYLKHSITTSILEHEYKQVNIPVGFEFNYNKFDCCCWGLKAYYDIDVSTKLSIFTPSINSQICSESLDAGNRFYIEMPFTYSCKLTDCIDFDWTFMPVFSWQKFGQPKCNKVGTSNLLNIPDLKQWHLGSVMTFGFNF